MDARHPCFNASAGAHWGRIHLPVAPTCNISCAYCNRKTDCPNESRPGVCSRILHPEKAAELVDAAVRRMPSLAVAGIAGPGDALAEPSLTLRTLELVRRRHPGLLLCLSTNGLNLAACAAELKTLGLRHVTITINAVTPAVAERVYQDVRLDGRRYHGTQAAAILLDRQEQALAAAERQGLAVKVNTVVIPGVNDEQVEAVACFAARFKVALMNCIGLIPVPGTAFGDWPGPSAQRLEALRKRAGKHVPQMRHCARCRADAFGLLAQDAGIDCLLPREPATGHACRTLRRAL
jgi:nitrogen fixation protein NifB